MAKSPEPGRSTRRLLLWGTVTVLLGIPFPAATASAWLMSRNRLGLIPLGALLAASMGLLLGTQAGVTTLVCAAAMALCCRWNVRLHHAMALTAGLTVFVASLPVYTSPVLMHVSRSDMESLGQIYTRMGIDTAMAEEVFSTMEYLAPGIGALMIAMGSMAAVLLLQAASRNRCFPPAARFMLRWETAWVLIACLAVRLFADPSSSLLPRTADNVLLFMALPYLIQGGAVALRWASFYPGMTVVLVITLLLATPMVLGGVLLTGVLDTWFDFRKKLDIKNMERLNS